MIIERTEHPSWLSNAYLVADGPGGHGVLIDGNGVVDPLLERIERDGITITHILNTHHHGDHVVDNERYKQRFGVPLVAHPLTAREVPGVDQTIEDGEELTSGDLKIRAIFTPGPRRGAPQLPRRRHRRLHGRRALQRHRRRHARARRTRRSPTCKGSVMDRLMTLPPETRVHPGHTSRRRSATSGSRTRSSASGAGSTRRATSPCQVRGAPATLVLWAPDYDGGHKAWVRFPDTGDDIVGGSQVTR